MGEFISNCILLPIAIATIVIAVSAVLYSVAQLWMPGDNDDGDT